MRRLLDCLGYTVVTLPSRASPSRHPCSVRPIAWSRTFTCRSEVRETLECVVKDTYRTEDIISSGEATRAAELDPTYAQLDTRRRRLPEPQRAGGPRRIQRVTRPVTMSSRCRVARPPRCRAGAAPRARCAAVPAMNATGNLVPASSG